MHWRKGLCLIVAALFVCAAAPAAAQDDGSDSEKSEKTQTKKKDEKSAESSDEKSKGESEEGEEKADDKKGKERKSEHGSYEFKISYGGGLEYGLFFTDLSRWNRHLLEPNDAPQIDTANVSSFNLAIEASVVEGSRFTLFAGLETPFSDNPQLTAFYGGIEPAFAFRRGFWEMALGFGIGLGSTNLETNDGATFDSGLVVLRPALELRRYFGEIAAGYLRLGFNQWLPFGSSSDDLQIIVRDDDPGEIGEENSLYEGGAFASVGVRFGHYPEHKKVVPDTDEDGLRDDIDDCDDEKEDKDEFEDWDGCPEVDNDEDGVNDDEDQCPNEKEDIDEWKDDDGCPEQDDDHDRDGILTKDDKCPKKAEDKDGFEDEDGCPDKDNDQDGVPDSDDDCPDEVGIPANSGCPSDIVTIEEKQLLVSEAIDFKPDLKEGEEPTEEQKKNMMKTALTDASKKVLDEVAEVLSVHEELAKVEIQSHTADGDTKAKKKESEQRATAVRDYLVEQGVNEGRLTASGMGFSIPIVVGEEEKKEAEEGKEPEPKPVSRVEFHIKKREKPEKKEGEKATGDTSAEKSAGDASESDESKAKPSESESDAGKEKTSEEE